LKRYKDGDEERERDNEREIIHRKGEIVDGERDR
jgi:hypothetical protein